MATNQYRRYLESRDNKRHTSPLGVVGNIAKGVVTVGAIGGSIYGGYKGLKAIGQSGIVNEILSRPSVYEGYRAVSRVANLGGRYSEAMGNTFKQAGFYRTLTGQADDVLQRNFTKSFSGYTDDIATGLSGDVTKLEKLLYDKEKALSVMSNTKLYDMRKGMAQDVMTRLLNNSGDKRSLFEDAMGTLQHIFSVDKKSEIFNAGLGHSTSTARDPINDAIMSIARRNNILVNNESRNEFNNTVKAISKALHHDYIGSGKTVRENFFENALYNGQNIGNILSQYKNTLEKSLDKEIKSVLKNDTKSFTNTVLKNAQVQRMTIGQALDKGLLKGRNRQGIYGGLDLHEAARRLGPDALNLPIDSSVFTNSVGDILDFRFIGRGKDRAISGLADNFTIPFIHIKPFQLVSLFNRSMNSAAENFAMFRAGTQMDTIANSADPLTQHYFHYGSKLFDAEGVAIPGRTTRIMANTVHGAGPKAVRTMTGATRRNLDDVGRIRKAFDLGIQEEHSMFERLGSWWNRRTDPDDIRNVYNEVSNPLSRGHHSNDMMVNAGRRFRSILESESKELDSSTFKSIVEDMSSSDSGVKDALNYLLDDAEEDSVIKAIEALSKTQESKLFNAEELLEKHALDPFNSNTEGMLKYVQAEIFSRMGLDDIEKTSKGLYQTGVLNKWQLNDIESLTSYARLTDIVNGRKDSSATRLRRIMADENNEMRNAIWAGITKKEPWYGSGKLDPIVDPFEGNEYILLNKAVNPISKVNEVLKSGGGVKEVFSSLNETVFQQLGIGGAGRAGRGAMDKVSTASITSYYYLYRLSEGLASFGLGLSSGSMGSTQDIAKNLYLKRILGPMAAFTAAAYLNDEIGNITGKEPSDMLAGMYARATLDVQKVKDLFGINNFSKFMGKRFPGIGHIFDNPIGMVAKYGSFGLIGDDTGYDNLKNYYERGDDPVRKGRYWSWGSSTPFWGGRIEFWQPSWYRRVIGEPTMTDSLWGSDEEYWANNWLPNPRNPLGVLKNVFDPYHWERKHQLDRPYPVTGGIPELEAIPLVGPILQGTIGNIIKPPLRKAGLGKAHRQYLEDINSLVTEQAYRETQPGYLYVTPGGRITPVDIDDSGMAIAGGSGGPGGFGGGSGNEGYPEGGIPIVGASGGRGYGSSQTRSQLSSINAYITSKASIRPENSKGLDALRDGDYIERLEEAVDPTSALYRLSETYYSMTEIGGIYGFATQTLFGDMAPRTILQSSSRMTGYERRWWDLRMGGFGDDISEIYRRFLPHKRNQIDEYNPFRNTMPDWMPGLEYFLDLKHGDPYVKVPQGEARLPGAGYESINKLHPDPYFGRYGALDRFKILADVAPWSEQYKYYSKVASKLHEKGIISDEDYAIAQTAREQARQRKEVYELYPYKFRYAGEIEKRNVTVDRIIDDLTFTAKELPGQVLKLAGIDLPSRDTEAGVAAREFISKHIRSGSKISIGMNEDALNRTSDDVMRTTRIAVFDRWGKPLQRELVDEIPEVKAKWDKTDANIVNALYTPGEIAAGKAWEWFAHLDTPFHTKFLQIRSPLEMYERQHIYGKSFQSWEHPIRDWITPVMQNTSTWNPLVAAGFGAGVGALTGTFSKSKNFAMKRNAIIGATIMGAAAVARVTGESIHRLTGDPDYTYIPGRRRKQREIEDYFDALKYVKYKGLYAKARDLAIKFEDADPDKLVLNVQSKSKLSKKMLKKLGDIKRWIKIEMSESTGLDQTEAKEKLKKINDLINGTEDDAQVLMIGPYARLALKYKQEYESTLFGADPNGDFLNIYRALPKQDRPFMKYFMTATPEEREKLLRILPKNQRRFYQAKWGMDVEDVGRIEDKFNKYRLPGADWEGWNPDVSLEKVKLKFVENKGLDIADFGFYADDLESLDNTPSIHMARAPWIDKGALVKVLTGNGISDAEIFISREPVDSDSHQYSVNADIEHDRRGDIMDVIDKEFMNLMN